MCVCVLYSYLLFIILLFFVVGGGGGKGGRRGGVEDVEFLRKDEARTTWLSGVLEIVRRTSWQQSRFRV